MKKKSIIKLILNIIAMCVPVGLIIYFLTSENGFVDLLGNASTFNWFWIFTGVMCQLLNIAIDAYTLHKFTDNYTGTYNYSKAFKCTAIGQFFSIITPGAVGGQPMQLYCLKKQNVNTGVASSVLIQKFLVYQTTITIYSFIATLFNLNMFSDGMTGVMATLAAFGFISHALVIIVMYMFSFNKKLTSNIISSIFNFLAKIKIIKDPDNKAINLENQLQCFHDSNSQLYKNKSLLVKVVLLTVIQLTLIFFIPYTIYRGFNFLGANAFDMITGQAFVIMVSSFMPLPGGSGAAEGSFFVFFEKYFTPGTIKSAILIWRIISYFMNIVIFAPFIQLPKNDEVKRRALENEKNS